MHVDGARCVGMGQGAWEWGKVRGNGARCVGMGQGTWEWGKVFYRIGPKYTAFQNWTETNRF